MALRKVSTARRLAMFPDLAPPIPSQTMATATPGSTSSI